MNLNSSGNFVNNLCESYIEIQEQISGKSGLPCLKTSATFCRIICLNCRSFPAFYQQRSHDQRNHLEMNINGSELNFQHAFKCAADQARPVSSRNV